MSIASEILRIQQAKQAIKESINDKGGTLTDESIDDYAQAIDNLPSGGGDIPYDEYALLLYYRFGKLAIFSDAWESSLVVDPLEISENSTTSTPRGRAQYPNGPTEGVIIPQGVTSIGDYAFKDWTSNNQPLVIPNSVTTIGINAFADWSSNNQPLVIPNSVINIGGGTFYYWNSNNQPLVIPDSVTSIGDYTFGFWQSNNQQLVIPNSVASIGAYTFRNWTSNNQPLVIPNSVTSIGVEAFRNWTLVPYVEMQSITPPTLSNSSAFDGQNDAPIYVPDASVDDYKTATNWVDLADRIFSINDK